MIAGEKDPLTLLCSKQRNTFSHRTQLLRSLMSQDYHSTIRILSMRCPRKSRNSRRRFGAQTQFCSLLPSTTIPSQRCSRTPSNWATGLRETLRGAANLLQSSAPLNVAARRSESPAPPSTDHDRPKLVPDQWALLLVANAKDKFGENLKLTDEESI